MKRLLVLLVFLLTINSALAQEPLASQAINWVHQLGTWSLLLFIVAGAIIFLGIILRIINPRITKYFTIIGLLILIFATFGVEIIYITPYLGKPVFPYKVCEQEFTAAMPPSNLPGPVVNIIALTACTLTGYIPTEITTLGIITFFIFGIIAPLGVLMALFFEFTDFLTDRNVRRVMTFLSALIAYRFLLSSMTIEVLGYGFAGVGKLLIDFFFFMIIFRIISKLWIGYEQVDSVLSGQAQARLASAVNEKNELEKLRDELKKTGQTNTAQYKSFDNRVKNLEKLIKDILKHSHHYAGQTGPAS
jgi:hypothetical protein